MLLLASCLTTAFGLPWTASIEKDNNATVWWCCLESFRHPKIHPGQNLSRSEVLALSPMTQVCE